MWWFQEHQVLHPDLDGSWSGFSGHVTVSAHHVLNKLTGETAADDEGKINKSSLNGKRKRIPVHTEDTDIFLLFLLNNSFY